MIVALVVLASVVVLGVGLVVSDRLAAARAEHLAATHLVAQLGPQPRVRVHGTPFLTQALRGRYRDVEVHGGRVQIGVLAGATLHAHLVNAYLPLRDLLGRRASELPVEHVHGSIVLPYAELARVSPVPGLTLQFRDGRLVASATLPVPGLSQVARLTGEAVVALTDRGGVSVRVRDVAIAGITVPGIVLNQLLPALAFPVPLPPLPHGLRIDQVVPTATGLEAFGSAQAVVFRRPGGSVDQSTDHGWSR